MPTLNRRGCHPRFQNWHASTTYSLLQILRDGRAPTILRSHCGRDACPGRSNEQCFVVRPLSSIEAIHEGKLVFNAAERQASFITSSAIVGFHAYRVLSTGRSLVIGSVVVGCRTPTRLLAPRSCTLPTNILLRAEHPSKRP